VIISAARMRNKKDPSTKARWVTCMQAFGRVPVSAKDEAPIEHMGPNRGVILIGETYTPEGNAGACGKPHYVQLSDGRKIRGPEFMLTDGNVLATCR
jgi:hypothetical protein